MIHFMTANIGSIDTTGCFPVNGRKGGSFQTRSGVKFYPLDPRPEEILIEDIAHALAHECRWNNQVQFYSVAQHSVLVSRLCPLGDALWGLLHDASEAYIGDVPKPLKVLPEWAFYREIERNLMAMICEKFGLPAVEPASVQKIDAMLRETERWSLLEKQPYWGDEILDPANRFAFTVFGWSPRKARSEFLQRFAELTGASSNTTAPKESLSGA